MTSIQGQIGITSKTQKNNPEWTTEDKLNRCPITKDYRRSHRKNGRKGGDMKKRFKNKMKTIIIIYTFEILIMKENKQMKLKESGINRKYFVFYALF